MLSKEKVEAVLFEMGMPVGYKQYGVRHSFLENYDGEPGSASENAADAAE